MTQSSFQADPNPGTAAGIPADGPASDATVSRTVPRIVPGWALRATLGAATVAASFMAMLAASQIEATSVLGVLLVIATVGTMLAPGSVWPLAVMIGVVLFRLEAGGPILDGMLMALVALLPLIHQLAGVCAAIPARSACHWSALRPAMIRYAMVVAPVEFVVGAVLIFG